MAVLRNADVMRAVIETLEQRQLLAAGSLSYDLVCSDYQFVPGQGGTQIQMQGDWSVTGASGTPQLPGRIVRFALPPSADLSQVQVTFTMASERAVAGTYDLAPVPAVVSDATAGTAVTARDAAAYASDAYLDQQAATFLDVQQMGAWKLAEVWYSPFSYNPATDTVRVAEDVKVQISYSGGAAAKVSSALAAPDASMVDNYAQAASWYQAAAAGTNAVTNLVILTTSAIVNGSIQFASFVQQKQSRGLSVQVVTEAQWGGGSGNTAAENLRNWLKSNYIAQGIQNVLLIGNPDPGSGDVPMKMCWPRYGAGDGYEESPSDYYFADLTSNWDPDGDGHAGEWYDDFVTKPLHEVNVGRIPVYGNSYTALDSILAKIQAYADETDTSWRKSMLLPMAISNYANEDGTGYNRTDGVALAESIKTDLATPNGYTTWRMYEQAGLTPVTVPADEALSEANVVNRWANNSYGIVDWWAHGSDTGAFRKYWLTDTSGDGIPDADELDWPAMFQSSDAASLNNAKPSFVAQVSCENGWPELSTNLGYSLLSNGAIGTLAASRVSWYPVGTWQPALGPAYGDNASYAYYSTQRLVQGFSTETFGAALSWCRDNLGIGFADASWMNVLDFNLYGDPTLTLGGSPQAASPDLVGTHLSSASPTLATGQITVDLSIANQGNSAATGSNAKFYLSDDANIDPATDRLLNLSTSDAHYNKYMPYALRVAAIAAAQSYSTSVTLAVPAEDVFGTDGVYYIGVVLDTSGEIGESRPGAEANNSNQGVGLDLVQVDYTTSVYQANMSANPGWTFEGAWAFGQPTGAGGAHGNPDPNAGYTGNSVIGYNLNGDYANGLSTTSWATTPVIDCSDMNGVSLSFYRWLNVEEQPYDHAYVQYSTDGTAWTTLWQNEVTISDSRWVKVSFDLPAAANQSHLQIRWGMGTTDSSWTFSGWNIDDVVITGTSTRSVIPGKPSLVSDSGASATDSLTNLDNGQASQKLQFSVPNTIVGATVDLYADGVLVGSAVADSTTTTITTDGTTHLADGVHTFTACQTQVGKTSSDLSAGLAITVDTAIASPTLKVNDGAAQRSMVKSLTVSFAEPATLLPGAVTLQLSNGTTLPNVTLAVANPSGDQKTYVLSFSGTGLVGGSLPDGIYDLSISAAGAADLAGNALTANFSQRFHRLFGDADGNKVVNALDYAKMNAAYGRSAADPLFNSAFDGDNNGVINALDLAQFRKRYGLSFSY